jgi:hypothetical protein
MNNQADFHCVCGMRVPEQSAQCGPLAEHATRLEHLVAELTSRLQSKANALKIAVCQRDAAREELHPREQQRELAPKITRARLDVIYRGAQLGEPTSSMLLIEAAEALELVDAYRRQTRRCASCGYERCEHRSSPACEGFSES